MKCASPVRSTPVAPERRRLICVSLFAFQMLTRTVAEVEHVHAAYFLKQ